MQAEVANRVYEVLYSDTDSVFIEMKSEEYDDILKELQDICDYLNDQYQEFCEKYNSESHDYLRIDRDKVYERWLQGGAKKRYAGVFLWEEVDMRDKEFDDRLEVKGFEIRRSNTASITTDCQEKVLKMILTGESKSEVREYLKDLREKIYNGEKDLDLGIEAVVKPLEEYKNPDEQTFVRAWKWANNNGYDIGFKEPIIWWWCQNGDVKGIPLFEDDLPKDIRIDYDRMWKRTVENKLEPILDCIVNGKFDMNMFLEGREVRGLSSFG